MTSDQLLLSELDVRPIRVELPPGLDFQAQINIDGIYASRSVFDTDDAYIEWINMQLTSCGRRKLSRHERRIITRLTNDSR